MLRTATHCRAPQLANSIENISSEIPIGIKTPTTDMPDIIAVKKNIRVSTGSVNIV